jgi:hypothetical protein
VQCLAVKLQRREGREWKRVLDQREEGKTDHSGDGSINFIIQGKDFPSRVACGDRSEGRGGGRGGRTWGWVKKLDSQSVEDVTRLELSVARSQGALQKSREVVTHQFICSSLQLCPCDQMRGSQAMHTSPHTLTNIVQQTGHEVTLTVTSGRRG